jgi:hypothetical protein
MKELRGFTDATGVAWTVLRIEPEPVSPTLERLRETLPGAAQERRRPWLLFESRTGERRRLAPVPQEWDEPGRDSMLVVWCAMADPVPPAPERRSEDSEHPGEPETKR